MIQGKITPTLAEQSRRLAAHARRIATHHADRRADRRANRENGANSHWRNPVSLWPEFGRD